MLDYGRRRTAEEERAAEASRVAKRGRAGACADVCICTNCGYSRCCLEQALCSSDCCPLCGGEMKIV